MDILETPDIEPVHATGIELMREVAFDLLPALPLQPLAAFSPDAPPVGVHGFLLRVPPLPLGALPVPVPRCKFSPGFR